MINRREKRLFKRIVQQRGTKLKLETAAIECALSPSYLCNESPISSDTKQHSNRIHLKAAFISYQCFIHPPLGREKSGAVFTL